MEEPKQTLIDTDPKDAEPTTQLSQSKVRQLIAIVIVIVVVALAAVAVLFLVPRAQDTPAQAAGAVSGQFI